MRHELKVVAVFRRPIKKSYWMLWGRYSHCGQSRKDRCKVRPCWVDFENETLSPKYVADLKWSRARDGKTWVARVRDGKWVMADENPTKWLNKVKAVAAKASSRSR